MLKRVAIICAIGLVLSVLPACETCEGGEDYKFTLEEMSLSVNPLYDVALDTSRFYHQDSLALYFSIARIQRIAGINSRNRWFMSQVVACSPAEPYTTDRITSLVFIATDSVSDGQLIRIMPGDTLNRFFNSVVNQNIPMNNVFPMAASLYGTLLLFGWNTNLALPISVRFRAVVNISNGNVQHIDSLLMKLR